MQKLLDQRDPAVSTPESVFERRLLRIMEREGLPTPVLQYSIHDAAGLIGVVDFAYPDARLAIEADGYRWHSGRVRWERDRARLNRLTLLGWRVIHVTWTELTRQPKQVIATIDSALSSTP